jgi:hypothetical protein
VPAGPGAPELLLGGLRIGHVEREHDRTRLAPGCSDGSPIASGSSATIIRRRLNTALLGPRVPTGRRRGARTTIGSAGGSSHSTDGCTKSSAAGSYAGSAGMVSHASRKRPTGQHDRATPSNQGQRSTAD